MNYVQCKLRPLQAQELTSETVIPLLPRWLEIERSMYKCVCGSDEDDCACLELESNKLPPLSDYFEKVSDETV